MSDQKRPGKVEILGPKDLVAQGAGTMAPQPFDQSAFNLANEMKQRLGFIGRIQVGMEERRIARQELKQVLQNELKAQTELMLHRNRLDLDYFKKLDQAGHAVRVRKVEEFLFNQESEIQYVLNDMIQKFEDAFTDQYLAQKSKVEADFATGKIDQSIRETRVARIHMRYESAMDKTLDDMSMIIKNHKINMENTLKTFIG